jgi:hypothetical protein
MSNNFNCYNKVFIIQNAINKDELNALRYESYYIYKHYNNINNKLKLKGNEDRELSNLGCSLDLFEDSQLHEYHKARLIDDEYFKYIIYYYLFSYLFIYLFIIL